MKYSGRTLVLLFAVVNALLYCCLLPLWEGFDEPFHYAYVQELSKAHQLPVLGKARISLEVKNSLASTPLSFILKRSIPNTFAFEDWFAFDPRKKTQLVGRVNYLDLEAQGRPSTLLNYETQQAPLAYLLAAPLDVLLEKVRLRSRILTLRITISMLAIVLIWAGSYRVCQDLGLKEPYCSFCLAILFETQIVLAAVAHIADDWLGIAFAVWFFAFLGQLLRRPSRSSAVALGAIVGGGLLTKAYFLPFLPVYVCALLFANVRSCLSMRATLAALVTTTAISGPWYLRNLLIYRSLSGMQESIRGATLTNVFLAMKHIDWPSSLIQSARWSLWTGNETHLAFSQTTLNLELVLLLAGIVLLILKRPRFNIAEGWIAAAVGVSVTALLYDLCLTWVDTQGLQTTTGPYYAPCVLPEILSFACLGFQRSGIVGRVLAVVAGLLSSWIAALTYLAKLIPYYGGLVGRSNLPVLWKWWTHHPVSDLFATTLAPAPLVMVLLGFTLILLAALTCFVVVQVSRDRTLLQDPL